MKRIDFANLFPQVSGKLYADKEAENYGGDNYDSDRSYEAKAIVSWEVDLWGNLRWAKDKSMADFLGSIEAQRALKIFRGARRSARILKKRLTSRLKLAKIALCKQNRKALRGRKNG